MNYGVNLDMIKSCKMLSHKRFLVVKELTHLVREIDDLNLYSDGECEHVLPVGMGLNLV